MPHQLDRMEEMLLQLTANLPAPDHHVLKRDVSILVVDMFRFMREGRKIESIKAYRTLTGYGLKESKDEIESIMSRMMSREIA